MITPLASPEPPRLFRVARGSDFAECVVSMRTVGLTPEVSVWSRTFASPEDAEAFTAWLDGRSETWGLWGRIASILGAETLDAVVGREFNKHADGIAKENKRREDEDKIVLYYDDTKRTFGLKLQKGSEPEPFWRSGFSNRWERDRLLDWMTWQRDRHEEFHRHATEHGATSLDGLLLKEMMDTERRLRKSGYTVGGQRPLRFWRGQP